jgi:hypothetical protein
MLNLGNPELAFRTAMLPNDAVAALGNASSRDRRRRAGVARWHALPRSAPSAAVKASASGGANLKPAATRCADARCRGRRSSAPFAAHSALSALSEAPALPGRPRKRRAPNSARRRAVIRRRIAHRRLIFPSSIDSRGPARDFDRSNRRAAAFGERRASVSPPFPRQIGRSRPGD